ncbi:TetR/AcrR family transcriptional regulator [Nocardioides panacisoli]|uniref:TetR/AcrR family transcriptional regulator n=1 Tax=Nocardioides panacisoli TaxID=627624 RepID=UPI001C62C623|nr:TetR/AcrR family transcriptional regulator [Nocardioides panacisoli]QYJ03243.1 TetR/AcrR family transcriptional regulator [Nocardioides panacisoli]
MTDTEDEPRDWRAHDRDDLPATLRAALDCFVQQGYHGTSIRELAAAAGLSVAGLYHHHRRKQDLLVACLRHAMEDLWWRSLAADDPDAAPVDRLAAHVECLVLFHARRQDLAFVAWSEIRGLEDTERAAHIERRDRQQSLTDAIVTAGCESGDFALDHPEDTARALVTMCTGVAQWYRPSGGLTPEDVADRYVAMALDLVRARGVRSA